MLTKQPPRHVFSCEGRSGGSKSQHRHDSCLRRRTGSFLALVLLSLAACSQPQVETSKQDGLNEAGPDAIAAIAANIKADRILVDKSDRTLILYSGDTEIARYGGIRFGDAPMGHKRFEGDERTPEGDYTIDARNPGSSYHLSLRISYPNAADIARAKASGKSAGGDIFIHGQPNGYSGPAIARDWTDGCIAVSNEEIRQIWKLVPDGAKITIQP